ncbi:MAG: hypothetical protein Q9182_002815 [Xanthomendoza sp. 2 TL-2023]
MSTYRFSSAVTDAELKRWGISTTMDVRIHKQEHLAHEGSQECLREYDGYSSETGWYYELCAYGMDLEINETEREQASRPTRAMIKAILYTNEFYSWGKEKAEQEKVAAGRSKFNAVAILMKEHQISEANALQMVRDKALDCEKEHWAAVADLEAAGPISANLYRYLDMTRFCQTGGMLWSAFADRYDNIGQTQDLKTPENLSMPKDENTLARQESAPANNSSSKIEPEPPTNGMHFQDSKEAVTEIDGK